MAKFTCDSCGYSFVGTKDAVFCPYCGGRSFHVDHDRARKTALVLIAECNELAAKMAPVWSEYVTLLAQYEAKMQTLRAYKMRGIVQEDEMPKNAKKFLKDALAEYRSRRSAKGGETGENCS